MTSEEAFNKQVHQLIEKYGQLDSFSKALNTGQVTRQIIQKAKFNLLVKSTFFYLISIVIMILGLTGFLESKPLELLFLIPIGFIIFMTTGIRAQKIKKALAELSKLAVGIHAEKLARD